MDAAKQIHLIAKGNQGPSPHPDKTSASLSEKVRAVSDKIRQVFQVRSGWAVLTADSETRDFLVEKQADWAAELGATIVETNKEWFTYVVSDFPTRLTDFHGKEVDSDSIALIKPTFISAQLSQREHTACSADSPKNNEDTSGPLARRHTDNDTRHNNQNRIWKPNVGKIPPAHDCALALADSERYDIVLL
ncbi:hypothetical protein FMUND_14390 [Fusarium mundagurra]|uniref:Uncharacterized protein n=1 Tax=Fusarium mundagurra TaxID=1567541 RepID=A0A8H5XVJ0_9HYPO|nr:hypothetical protein FMUND_14390 [Fusarium mundagurra]